MVQERVLCTCVAQHTYKRLNGAGVGMVVVVKLESLLAVNFRGEPEEEEEKKKKKKLASKQPEQDK